ncbi:riboflavin synthase [Clostridiaceae bacterium M8S5]|nr:riboflavin synthase [Clostridiaceae bacterium M8S5]
MFTGIVEEIGMVVDITMNSNSAQLKISADKILTDLNQGDSVCTNGVCLTVTSYDEVSFSVDVMTKTLQSSNLRDLKYGDKVNLERALKMETRLGGHILSGHVDTTGVIQSIERIENALLICIKPVNYKKELVIDKGSIGIDGISLTVAEITESDFTVAIIPHTLSNTILKEKIKGDTVNLEYDILGKYVQRFFKVYEKADSELGISYSFLEQNNFLR